LLRSAGCDETQGYFHCRPLTEAELAAAVARRLTDGDDFRGDDWTLSAPRPRSLNRA